jgi:hypothetical protein
MPEELPIACSLSVTDLTARLRAIADLGRDALLDSRIDGAGAHLRFAASPGVRDRVDAIVAAESECCAFLTMRVAEERDGVRLTIAAPAGAEFMVVELIDAFAAGAPVS